MGELATVSVTALKGVGAALATRRSSDEDDLAVNTTHGLLPPR